MKAIFSFLVFSSTLISFLNAAEKNSYSEQDVYEKTYIDPNQVRFAERKIYVNVDDLWMQTTAIFVDDNGFYIDSFRQADESSFSWKCSNCGKYNEAYRDVCKKCGEPKS